jgi:cytidine deaminase
MTIDDVGRQLRTQAVSVAERAFAPYSRRMEGCVVLLDDGSMVAGARVESASFSLLIPASINALSTVAALGRSDAVAIAVSHEPTSAERAILESTFAGNFAGRASGVFVRTGRRALPSPASWLDPTVDRESAGIEAARAIAARAVVPQSDFPVGCIAVTDRGHAVPGVNVEHDDWARVICAERNALGTIITYDLGVVETMHLTCIRDPGGTPCGACRQLLAELAPDAEICMDRGADAAFVATSSSLLPGAFAGSAIPGHLGFRSS